MINNNKKGLKMKILNKVYVNDLNEVNNEYYGNVEDVKCKFNKDGYYNFTINKGRKYDKVVANTPGQSRSVHCFVGKETGHIFKPAGWNAPQLKTNIPVRGSIYEIDSYKNADPHGGWLYL